MRKRIIALVKWNRHRRFVKAYAILRNEHRRHRDAGHSAQFEAVDETRLILICNNCPEIQPMGHPPEYYE